MQKITVLCVGKLKEAFYEQAVKEYEKRLSRCCKLELLELPEQRLGDEPSEAEIRQIMRQQMGKMKPSDELNCGSCGYDTCREKAIAIY